MLIQTFVLYWGFFFLSLVCLAFSFCVLPGIRIADLVKGTGKPIVKLALAGIWLLLILCSLWAPTFQNII